MYDIFSKQQKLVPVLSTIIASSAIVINKQVKICKHKKIKVSLANHITKLSYIKLFLLLL